MHSQSANFGKFKLNSLNVAAFFSLNPVFQVPLQVKISVRASGKAGEQVVAEQDRRPDHRAGMVARRLSPDF